MVDQAGVAKRVAHLSASRTTRLLARTSIFHVIREEPPLLTWRSVDRADGGHLTHVGGDANIVPVVADGKVYVASYKQLQIFGLAPAASSQAASIAVDNSILLAAMPPEPDSGRVTYGVVR